MKKTRLDLWLVERGLAASREEAQRLIRAGKVLIKETVADKPGHPTPEDAVVRVIQPECRYASRGGLKLEAALDRFVLNANGLIAADLGASTGGFTDCLLQRGAAKVYAVDVGSGQLAYRLQVDIRVVVMDRTNSRYLTGEDLGEMVDLVVADLSFISIRTVFPAIARILKPGGRAVLLIKPQFEIGKGRVGKKGIVREPKDHLEVLKDCYHFLAKQGWSVTGVIPSPILGKTGNVEFLIQAQPGTDGQIVPLEQLPLVVEEAHQAKNASVSANPKIETTEA